MKKHYTLDKLDGGITILEVIAQKMRLTNGKEYPVRIENNGVVVQASREDRPAIDAAVAAGSYELIYPTPQDCVAKWPAAMVTLHKANMNIRPVAFSDLPTDRSKRDAWERGADGKITINQAKLRTPA
jgi:hypothetical protein